MSWKRTDHSVICNNKKTNKQYFKAQNSVLIQALLIATKPIKVKGKIEPYDNK